MSTKRFAVAGLALATTLALALSGCAQSSSDNSNNSSAKGTSITYWASNQGTSLQNDVQVLTPVLKKFTEETGVKVNLQVIGWNDLQTKIQTAVTSGQGPDVLNIGNTWGSWLQSTGAFVPFDGKNAEAIGGLSRFNQAALAAGGAPGKTPTSVPLYGLAYGLYYNKKMFSDAGLQPPTTWSEMVSDAQKLTDPSKNQWGISLAAGSYTENAHFAFITSSQDGGAYATKSGDPSFATPQNVTGIMRYLNLMQSDKVANPADSQYSTGTPIVADFAAGRAAMVLSQNNADASILADGMSADAYGVVPLPAPSDAVNNTASHVAGINISILKSTKNLTGSLEFVKYMTSTAVQEELGKPYSALPVLKDAKATFTTNAAEAKTFMEIYANRAKPLPQVSWEGNFESTVGKMLNDMFAKIATGSTVTSSYVESALKTAEQQVQAQN